MKRIKFFFILLCVPLMLSAQAFLPDSMVVCTDEDKAIFDDYVQKFLPCRDSSMNWLMLHTGFYFLGTPYVSYTLEVTDTEKLIVNLRQLDCTTFTETCLALARTIKNDCGPTFDAYICELTKIRYRYGLLEDYTSRLHYFTDWIHNNNDMDIVRDLTVELGGIPYPMYVNTMTRLRNKYVHLKDNDDFCARIDTIEKEISAREHFYIPKNRIDSVEVKEGDIVAMTISGKGLDIMHMGIAVIKEDRLYFMHASSVGKEVMITLVPFYDYLCGIKSCTGCMVLRPLPPEE